MKLLILTNSNFVGDNNQLKGIAAAIQAKIKEKVEVVEVAESAFDISLLDGYETILVSGSHGLEMADTIKSENPGIKVIWSGHQYFSELDTINHRPDIIALPETSVSSKQKAKLENSGTVVFTTGVAHSVNNEAVAGDYTKFKGQLPKHATFSIQIGIILAGDAPTADNKMKFFTVEDAVKQAKIIAKKIKIQELDTSKTAVMVTNGPRTGKHDPLTGSAHDPEPHRCNQVDASSEAFLDALKKELMEAQIFFYDFQFSALKDGPSAYKPMIKQVADSENGLWFVPAESTSMVTEASFFLESHTPVVIYHPESENEAHVAHAEDAVAQGFAYDVSGADISPMADGVKAESAATSIAKAFYEKVVLLASPKISTVSSTLYPAGQEGGQNTNPSHDSYSSALK